MKLTENQLQKIIIEETKKALTEIVPAPVKRTAGRLFRLAPWNWYGTRKFGAKLLEKNDDLILALGAAGVEARVAANFNMRDFLAYANKNIKDVEVRDELVRVYRDIYVDTAKRLKQLGTDYLLAIGEDLNFMLRMAGDPDFGDVEEAAALFKKAVSDAHNEFRNFGAGARFSEATPAQVAAMRVPNEVKDKLLMWVKKVDVDPDFPSYGRWSTPIEAADIGRVLGKYHEPTIDAIKALGWPLGWILLVTGVVEGGKRLYQWGFAPAKDAGGDTGGGGVAPEDE